MRRSTEEGWRGRTLLDGVKSGTMATDAAPDDAHVVVVARCPARHGSLGAKLWTMIDVADHPGPARRVAVIQGLARCRQSGLRGAYEGGRGTPHRGGPRGRHGRPRLRPKPRLRRH